MGALSYTSASPTVIVQATQEDFHVQGHPRVPVSEADLEGLFDSRNLLVVLELDPYRTPEP